MSSQIVSVFTNYQKARVAFAQNVADLATRVQNVDFLRNANTLKLLKPLLNDEVAPVQQAAAMAVARLAAFNQDTAIEVVNEGLLETVIRMVDDCEKKHGKDERSPLNASRHLKKAGAVVLRSIAKHSEKLAMLVAEKNGIDSLNTCLQDFDAGVKEAASWSIGYVASHSEELANIIINTGSVPLLTACAQEPELNLKRVAFSALSDIAKHSELTARATIDAGALKLATKLILHSDAKVRKQSCTFLATIAKHNVDLAEVVVDCDVVTDLVTLLQDDDQSVQRNAADCLREISKHSIELARILCSSGGLIGIIDLLSQKVEQTFTNESVAMTKLPAVMFLGYIASFSETLAASIIAAKGVETLKPLLAKQSDQSINEISSTGKQQSCNHFIFLQAATAWTLGKICSHSTEHALACAENDILRLLSNIYIEDVNNKSTSIPIDILEDLQNKAGESLQSVLDKCTHLPALQAMLTQNEDKESKLTLSLLRLILRQIGKVLPNDRSGKKLFVQSGALQFVQELEQTLSEEDFTDVQEVINVINTCYPPQIINYYSPKHAEELIKLLDAEEEENEEFNVEEKS